MPVPSRTVAEPFTFHDGERVVHFGRGVATRAVDLVGGPGYALLTTERAAGAAPGLVDGAAAVHHVGAGLVDELAGDLLAAVAQDRVVALGGGRVVDTAKAIVAARGSGIAAAVPTTLSGAELTRLHRRARGAPADAAPVRPAIVVCDPALAASQDAPALAASAANALGHAVEAPCTERANPISTLAATEAARKLAGAWEHPEPDRDALALGALLAGYAIDSSGYGLHHVLAQTLVRVGGAPHGHANAVLLPHTTGALSWRFPRQHATLTAVLDEDPADAAERLCARSGIRTLRDLGIDKAVLARCADAAAERQELDLTPPRADRAELLALYERAW